MFRIVFTDILESLHYVSLHNTHQKWINHKGQTVYIYSESVDTLNKCGYIVEKSEFFNNS